jgi:hypothetical protein
MLLTAIGTATSGMPLRNRRHEYNWPKTRIDGVHLVSDKKSYSLVDTISVNLSFRIVGGLRQAFHPEVWTLAWEDFDKIMRLTLRISLRIQRGLRSRTVADSKKEVRKASFYWSRDPDLPYRIWAMIIPEDGGPPRIPRNVEDAKSNMLDIEKGFTIPASSLGPGEHKLVASVTGRWGRRSFIEKGEVASKSKPLVIKVG